MEHTKYKVEWFGDYDLYTVSLRNSIGYLHKGSLDECWAWIQLKTKGYFDED